MSGVVLLLPSEVPGHEGDAPEAGLTLTDSLVVRPVTDHYAHCGKVLVLVGTHHSERREGREGGGEMMEESGGGGKEGGREEGWTYMYMYMYMYE